MTKRKQIEPWRVMCLWLRNKHAHVELLNHAGPTSYGCDHTGLRRIGKPAVGKERAIDELLARHTKARP